MTVDLGDVPPVTLACFDRACRALGADPEAVRVGEAGPLEVTPEASADLLAVLAPGAALPGGAEHVAASELARAFFSRAREHARAASEEAQHQAEAAGVWGVLKEQPSSGAPLSRSLARLDAADYRLLYCELPMREAMRYLLLRSVDHISRNLKDHL